MRGAELLEKMELIDPAYVEAADTTVTRKKAGWIRWAAVAACLTVTLAAGVWLLPPNPVENTTALPMLWVTEDDGLRGCEGYWVYDVEELVSANPWNETETPSVLPVYKNVAADEAVIRERALDVARRMGVDTDTAAVTVQPVGERKLVIVKAKDMEILVSSTLTATILFQPSVPLPEAYNFTHFASYADTVAAAEYLKDTYADLLQFDEPQVNVCGGDYTIYDGQLYLVEIFEGRGSAAQRQVNFHFDRAVFGCDDDGNLGVIQLYQPALSVKMGDYPLISCEQAKELLRSGRYWTSVPYEISETAVAQKAELVYRVGDHENYYMPYYRFYVEIPEMKTENGRRFYGAYYVPAVESAYIANLPVRDGSLKH